MSPSEFFWLSKMRDRSSSCDVIVKKALSVRTHACKCGCVLQRDTNAAVNILSLGKQATVGQTGSNATGLAASTLLGETKARASG